MSRNITKLNGFNSRLREEATSQIDAVRETVGSFNSRLREEATWSKNVPELTTQFQLTPP